MVGPFITRDWLEIKRISSLLLDIGLEKQSRMKIFCMCHANQAFDRVHIRYQVGKVKNSYFRYVLTWPLVSCDRDLRAIVAVGCSHHRSLATPEPSWRAVWKGIGAVLL
jgi:hypothetical protein